MAVSVLYPRCALLSPTMGAATTIVRFVMTALGVVELLVML